MKQLPERIKFVEALLGADLPAGYRSFLSQPFSQPTKLLAVPSSRGDFDVREFLRLDDGADYLQLDSTFKRVHAALPSGMVPIASDIAGNFYCIVVMEAQAGRIVWWDHEREVGDHHVEDVAASFDDFMSSHRMRRRSETSMFSVRCSMFDVKIPDHTYGAPY
jgi:SMI1 / KNR4 family (SUKH-1)